MKKIKLDIEIKPDPKQVILEVLKDNQYITVYHCEESLGIPKSTASWNLKILARNGAIKDLGYQRIKIEGMYKKVHVYERKNSS